MTPCSWIRPQLARRPRRAPQGPRLALSRFRPSFEVLEDRLTPSMLGTTALFEGPAAGSASDVVSTSDPWSASSNAPWLHTSAAGTGNGLASLSFDANPGATRSGTLTIAGLTLTVTQAVSTYVPANPLTALVSFPPGLNDPLWVAVDGAGDVFISDPVNNAVDEWHAATGTVSTLVSSGLYQPNGVAVDAAGDVFIADTYNNAIKEWHAATGTVSTLVSSGLWGPRGVAVDPTGDVFFSDNLNNAVKEWHAATGTVSTLVSSGLNLPLGVAVDAAGDVFIADTRNNAVKEWHAVTGTVSTLVSSGLSMPWGVAVDAAGNVFIANNDYAAVEEWHSATGTVSPFVSSGLDRPYGVAVDATGDVFIADPYNNAVREVPRAFVPGGAVTEAAAAGADALLPVLPTTQPLTGALAPSSDQSWLTIDRVASGVVHFTFTENTGPSRTAHLSVLGQQIAVTQQGTPTITWNTPAAITYGTPLGPTQLNATADMPGTFTYTPPAGTVLQAGPQALTVVFTPADSTGATFSKQVALTVYPAPLTVTADDASRWYGRPNDTIAFTATYDGFVNGDTVKTLGGALAFQADASTSSPPGKYTLTPLGLTASNYQITYVPGTLTVTPALLSTFLNPAIQTAAGQSGTYQLTKVDNVDPFGTADSYTATIDWGDQTTSLGTIVAEDPAYYYDVSGTHTYSSPGSYTVRVTVQHKLDYTTPATATGSAQVSPALSLGGPPLQAEQAFVQALYQDLLGRQAEAQGLAAWTGLLQAGSTRLQVVQGIWNAPEHRGLQVDQFYATYLHRAADAPGRAFWVSALLGGVSEQQVAAAFLTSAEYQQAHASPTAYLFGLYADVLGRAPDPDGLASWQAAAQGGLSRAALAQGFLQSPEKQLQLVDGYYADFLGRAGEPAGVAAWMKALQGSQLPPAQVVQAFLASDEFYGRIAPPHLLGSYGGPKLYAVAYNPTWPDWSSTAAPQLNDSDFFTDAFKGLWGTDATGQGRQDLATIRKEGFNLLRLYNWGPSRGWNGSAGTAHLFFLDQAQELGLKVIVPVSNYFLGDDLYSWDGQNPDANLSFGSAPLAIQNDLLQFISSVTEMGQLHPAVQSFAIGNEMDVGIRDDPGSTAKLERALWWVVNLHAQIVAQFGPGAPHPLLSIPISNADQGNGGPAKSWFQLFAHGVDSGDATPLGAVPGGPFSAFVKGLDSYNWYTSWFYNSVNLYQNDGQLTTTLQQYDTGMPSGPTWSQQWPGEKLDVPLLLTELGTTRFGTSQDAQFTAVALNQAQVAENVLKTSSNLMGYTIFEANDEPNKNNYAGPPASETFFGMTTYDTSSDQNQFRNGTLLYTLHTGATPWIGGTLPDYTYPVFQLFPIQSADGTTLPAELKTIFGEVV